MLFIPKKKKKKKKVFRVHADIGKSFGTIAMLLQLVPMLSMVFLMTSAAGSALWAADIEQKRSLLSSADVGIMTARTRDLDMAYWCLG